MNCTVSFNGCCSMVHMSTMKVKPPFQHCSTIALPKTTVLSHRQKGRNTHRLCWGMRLSQYSTDGRMNRQMKMQRENEPVPDKTVDNVTWMNINNQHCVELGSVVLWQLRSNLNNEHTSICMQTQAFKWLLSTFTWISQWPVRSITRTDKKLSYMSNVTQLYTSWVLWRCWLGGRKGIWPVKNWLVGCW